MKRLSRHSNFVSYFAILFALLPSHFLFSQSIGRFQSMSINEGLNQNSVWEVFEDSRGLYWISTADGINLWNGSELISYRFQEQDSCSIGGMTAFSFIEDKLYNIWITHNGGISVYQRYSGCFINIPLGDVRSISHAGFTKDHGQILIVYNQFLLMYDVQSLGLVKKLPLKMNLDFTSLKRQNAILKNNTCFYNNNHLIIINRNQLSIRYEKMPLKSTPENSVFCLNEHEAFITDGFEKLILSEKQNGDIELKKSALSSQRSQTLTYISGHVFNNEIWLAGSNGISILDANNFAFKRHVYRLTDSKSKKPQFYYHLFKDTKGNLVISTNTDGLLIYSPSRNRFTHLRNDVEENNMVKSILKTTDERIVVGHYGQGLSVYDKNFSRYDMALENSQPFSALALSEMALNQWLCISENKVFVIDGQQLRTRRYIIQNDGMQNNLQYPQIKRLNGSVAYNINYLDSGVIYSLNSSFEQKQLLTLNHTLITAFHKVNDEWLIGTDKALLLINSHHKDTLLSDVYVKAITLHEKKLYAATRTGLFVIDLATRKINHYNENNGLKNNFLYGLLIDNSGAIWMSHNKGITRFRDTGKTFRHYTIKDGLQSNEFNTGAYHIDRAGNLYFGGINGVNIIHPQKLADDNATPNILLNKILVNDLEYPFDSLVNEKKQLLVDYTENTLSFDFAVSDITDNEYEYFYQLVGWDEQAIKGGNKHFVRYSNLPPGEYQLVLSAVNSDGIKGPDKILNILISPPFWQQNWFMALSIMLGLFIIYLPVYWWQVNKSRKLKTEVLLQQKIEAERRRISRDLHDNVGAQLSYLITNLDWMQEHPDMLNEEEKLKRLSNLSDAGREAILTLRETIWAANSETLSIDDFADRFKQYVLRMKQHHEMLNVRFEERFDVITNLSPTRALGIFRICQEAFSNALKHSKATQIQISFAANEQGCFVFTIQDNGVGFDTTGEYMNHYGLVNMKARAAELGAQLEIVSEKGKGAHIKLTLHH
jgi:signal transduction histidine kinase/ligand-binding sensor domain-containing protein